VTESLWEHRFVGLEGGVSELHHAVVPDEELPAEQGSQSSDRASECYGSPVSDIYEDVLGSCSPTSSSPAQIDAESPVYGKVSIPVSNTEYVSYYSVLKFDFQFSLHVCVD